ncbi:DUF1330 domain-containing protein [Phycicoccus sp. CSK15P-2]|uniref:DUF1330 domain-containing protein n=1 Tax=Phycicoccus sp. CSK15P-2 TaxID=2807627 RepID=UPI00194E411E|nr:DUF1330 domain-containing protein [Phycicoccus sp. CSK15P-2]MBM6404174.1 DUF1330 domain-containing protein [Phycicoccus sp. CSK15P-2]
MADTYLEPAPDALSALAGLPDDEPVVMLNLLRFRDSAEYPAGVDAEPCSGREAYERYSCEAVRFVRAVGGEPVFQGASELAVIGPEGEWDEVLLVRYPSRAAFLAMVSDPDYLATTVHRTAALADSRLVATRAG